MKQNLHLMATLWPLLRLRAFFNRRLDPTKMQSISCTGMSEAEAHMEVLWQTKVSRENSRLTSCPSRPSLTLPSGPIPMCPAYTSVKNPKSGTLANSKRLHSGRKAYREGHGMGWNACSSTTRGWFKYTGAIVLPLLGCASAFSRSIVEGFSKPRRTIVEALSKDFRTSLEQQSNTCRRNFEESCVWTHAVVPARYGLGLALGLMVLFFLTTIWIESRAQLPDFKSASAVKRPNALLEGLVKGAVSNLPLEGASICIKETGQYAFANQQGHFSLSTDQINGTLVIRFEGYETVEVQYEGGALIKGQTTIRLNKDASAIPPLVVGDSIPDMLWDMPLAVINHPAGRTQLTLREYKDSKLLILDFWATWCAPCVKSVQKWQDATARYHENGLAVMTVNVGFFSKTLPFMIQRKWTLPAAVGENTHLLNSYFFDRYQVGGVVWIKESRIAAISYENDENMEKLPLILSGKSVALHSTSLNSHQKPSIPNQ